MAPSSSVCLIAGPTGVGKTSVGIELARRWNSEIVSADSMQIYCGLPIGTAQPTPQETSGAPYHLVGMIDPGAGRAGGPPAFSAAEFLHRARPILDRLLADDRVPLVVGGTGLYLGALIDGLFEQPPIAPEIRAAVGREVDGEGTSQAHARLAEIDPLSARRIHPNDRVRIVRALEVHRATGKTLSALWAEGRRAAQRYPCALFVLNAPRRRLYERINERVERMFEEGLIEETRALVDRGLLKPDGTGAFDSKALGYRSVAAYLWGERDRAEAVAAVQQAHRNYAKRQMTWFRKMKGAQWISVEDLSPREVADRVEQSRIEQGLSRHGETVPIPAQ